ncbi:uncharacterized protein LOC127862559 isoform X2 [Dreissena polymorpha]|uniref:uncharacterized protein LOC127862559 isoform X2 n=1 Tax=Dreissena polymorpha TaxID=45954 RepID=UPI002264B0A9|nr:uncharacterized protein LOC127862559 isoform X2 [Dreissena polymorpha]
MGYLIYLRIYCILIIGFIDRVCTHTTVIYDNDKWQDFNVEQYTTNVQDSSLKTTLTPAKTLSVYSEQSGISGPISVYDHYIGGDDKHINCDDETNDGLHKNEDIDRRGTQGHSDLNDRRPRRDQPEQKSFRKGLEIDFMQNVLGEEHKIKVPLKRPKQMPGYVAMLYDILTEQNERTLIPAGSEQLKSKPKIRFYRGLFHGIGKNNWISYDMKDIDLEKITRLEFVVTMPQMKERNTSISLYVDADTGAVDSCL